MEKRTTHYIPGICNIGRDEIRVRTLTGLGGLSITSILLIIVMVVCAATIIRVPVFFPLSSRHSVFFRLTFIFTPILVSRSLFNFGRAATTPEEIRDDDMRKLDRRRSWTIIGYSALVATGVTLLIHIIPF